MYLKSKDKGYVKIEGKLDVTDPSYEKDIWCRMNDVAIKPGEYRCRYYLGEELGEREIKEAKDCAKEFNKDLDEVIKQDTADIRNRCFAIELQAKGRAFQLNSNHWEKIGEIGVDGGMAGFFWNLPELDDEDWGFFYNKMDGKPVCLDKEVGFWSFSGYGDGWYKVYAIKENDEIIALKICF